ncbi:MAG TPA: bacteriohemerythrin [Azospira sp.]|nr:bacteriohemerythrin [Azospira sp.]
MRDYGTVQFGPQYHVGIAQVDQEHQQLFAIVGRIQAALEQDSDTAQAQARQAVAELLDYTRTHFASEEALMAAAGYPELATHQDLHQDLLYQVSDMEMRVEMGEPSASLDLSRFLANWLINHIQAADRRFGAFVAPKA